MESIFLLILVFLAILAAVDLFVGVSNDAVNFLNSAIGSRIASFKVIMVVASIGVLLGSTFSSGMMEIARSGVFNPEMFTFNEIIIFFAVMITDVLLLDAFNSMGLPTSTTVPIVFELLGGAVAAALIKISTSDILLSQLGDFINSQKALAIVSGILISVVVAFVAGVVVQYITRMIFTFHYERMYRRIGGIFGGLSLTAIFYFLIMKGAKGASFMKPEYLAWINAHTLPILLVLFAGLSVVLHLLMVRRGVNIFKVVILAGTFALAFAFAGNDLVNFVGVPLAAWESWQQFTASGMAADAFTMEGLRKAVQTPTLYLLLSGLIMVLTPRVRPTIRSTSSPRAVSMSTGMAAVTGWALSLRQTSQPSMPGSMRSSTTRSGSSEVAMCSPPSPSAASSTAKPSRSRLKRSNWRISFSSSITSMRCMESSFALEK